MKKRTLIERQQLLLAKIDKAKTDLVKLKDKRKTELVKLISKHGLDKWEDVSLDQAFTELASTIAKKQSA